MQYVWQHRLWMPSDMKTVDGQRVDVLDPGLLNTGAGPDFFNAKLRIADRMWAGNVEIHVRASDWHRHGHDGDSAYDSVVLHVVENSDTRICRSNGETIPQLVMPCAADFSEHYHAMVNNPTAELMCADFLSSMPRIYITDWLTSLAFERLYDKSDRILRYLARSNGDWAETVYITLARALGFSTNSDPFERLAFAMPLRMLMKHRDSRVTVEGALLGQAALLDDFPDTLPADDYRMRLRTEHDFICRKYGLSKLAGAGWRFSGVRPHSFPHRRIATLAAMICGGFEIARRIFEVETREQAEALFDITLDGYWATRYGFGDEAGATPAKALSKTSVTILIINVVAPLLHAYGNATGRRELCSRAAELLQALPPENNTYTRLFQAAGVDNDSALTSQAIVQLRRNYCLGRKCLYCRIGHRYLAQKAIRRH